MELRGTPAERLTQLRLLPAEELTREWLLAELKSTLEELAEVEPIADTALERQEDF